MNLSSMLNLIEESEVRKIARNLGIVEPDTFKRLYLQSQIIQLLTDYNRLKNRILSDLNSQQRLALRQLVFTDRTIFKDCTSYFSKYGIVIGTMPDDIREMLIPKLRDQVIQEITGIQERIQQSVFLKLILLLEMIRKEELTIDLGTQKRKQASFRKTVEHLKIQLEPLLFERLLRYLKLKSLIKEIDHIIVPDHVQIHSWYKNQTITVLIKDFYSWIIGFNPNTNLNDLIQSLGNAQNEPEEWVDAEVLTPIIKGREKEIGEKLGLIQFFSANRKDNLRLTNEGWCLAKGEIPTVWKQKNIVISADGEIFIPYWENPLVVAIVSCFSTLKGNDYFLILDLDFDRIDTNNPWTFEEFFEIISLKCRHLPNVVLFELNRGLKKDPKRNNEN